jgi:hypothetical protein
LCLLWKLGQHNYDALFSLCKSFNHFIDIRAVKQDGTNAILIEVKGFEQPDSQVEALAEALGQYLLYQYSLEYVGLDLPLFLGVPIRAFAGILSEPLGEVARQAGHIKLMVFDPEKAEIVQWVL